MTATPPATGTTNWGTPLDAYLAGLQAEADQNGVNFADHVSAAPAGTPLTDPHGDRAYALALMAPIIQNINTSSGFVQLDANGILPGDTWHDLRPVTGNFGVAYTGLYPPQYRMTLDAKVELAGYVIIRDDEVNAYNGVTIFPGGLSAAYRPSMQVNLPVTLSAPGSAPPNGTPMLTVNPDGTMVFRNLPSGLVAGTFVGIYGWYPLDAYYRLLQS